MQPRIEQAGNTSKKTPEKAIDAILGSVAEQLMDLPFEARENVIESFSTLLLRDLVPVSGMTIQQPVHASQHYLDALNSLMRKQDSYRNGADARYVYQFAREATSAGVLPAYRNSSTGDLFIALVCNKRNLNMYNWSAGYTEAPPAGWRGKLLSELPDEIYYNRVKLKDSATRTMESLLMEADGDWTKVEYGYEQFAAGFRQDGVALPKMDLNSFHTASRESIEEISLDLARYPKRKTFLISYDNTVGISQGDAPGQTSNRSHQYLVFLGDFASHPDIQPGDDVAIAEWVNVSEINRRTPMAYFANNKPLCVYMLRSIELGLKELWNYLLARVSTRVSRYTRKELIHFSCPENLAAGIEAFCQNNAIDIESTRIPLFLKYLTGDLSFKTYTGKSASRFHACMLQVANLMLSPKLKPETFIENMTSMLIEFEKAVIMQHRLFPEDYYASIYSIYEQLPEKHAEKHAEKQQREISLRLTSGTPYLYFYEIFMRLNEKYGPNGDYASLYQGDPAFIRCRYSNIFTKRQVEFSNGTSLDVCLQQDPHQPGIISSGVYPAAKIPLNDNADGAFVVLGEGPFQHTYATLLDRLSEQKVYTLIAVGPPEENSKEKYFNYMQLAQEIDVQEYLHHTTSATCIPDELIDSQGENALMFRFYRYVRPQQQDVFYIMHIPAWRDLGMPVFTTADKLLLAYDAEYGGSRYYHCSAGVGRSVALIMMRMAYEQIFKKHLDFPAAIQQFEVMLRNIKEVKPRAGEWWQLLLALGVAQEMYEQIAMESVKKMSQKKDFSSSSLGGGITLFRDAATSSQQETVGQRSFVFRNK
jgi:hypothetical protein